MEQLRVEITKPIRRPKAQLKEQQDTLRATTNRKEQQLYPTNNNINSNSLCSSNNNGHIY